MKVSELPVSMKLASIWVLWGFLSLGVLGWGLKVVLEYVGSLNDAAAWVQAIGSILAILAAIGISQWTVIKQQRDKLRESYDYMQKALEVSCYGSETVAAASREILDRRLDAGGIKYNADLLEVALSDLKEIEYARLDDAAVAAAFLKVKRNVNLCRSAILLRVESGSGFDHHQVRGWALVANQQIEELKRSIQKYLLRHPWLLDQAVAQIDAR